MVLSTAVLGAAVTTASAIAFVSSGAEDLEGPRARSSLAMVALFVLGVAVCFYFGVEITLTQ